MTAADADGRQVLEQLRVRLTAELEAHHRALLEIRRLRADRSDDDEHDPEGQTIAYERSQLAALTAHGLTQLGEVEAALQRVAEGTYGTCEVCGRPIDPARLEARPTARTCVEHAPAARG